MTTPQETSALIRGQTVASFTSYAEAQRAVDYLSDHRFPVENSTFGLTVATRYDVYCVPEHAARASEMLAQMPTRGTG